MLGTPGVGGEFSPLLTRQAVRDRTIMSRLTTQSCMGARAGEREARGAELMKDHPAGDRLEKEAVSNCRWFSTAPEAYQSLPKISKDKPGLVPEAKTCQFTAPPIFCWRSSKITRPKTVSWRELPRPSRMPSRRSAELPARGPTVMSSTPAAAQAAAS